ncbi:MAG: TorF family putative porin [Burkholderiales bacterium]
MIRIAPRQWAFALCALGFVAAAAAQTTPQASSAVASTSKATPEPDYTLAYNIAGVTDYRYRGISQTRLNPTLQGGIDFNSKLGFYVGAWASGVKFIRDAGGDGSVEVDVYGGYKGTVGDFGYDVGVLHYQYPRNHLDPSANTTELYVGGSYQIFNLKYSHSVTNLFGFVDSKNSGYLDASATFDVGYGFTVVPHIGHQRVANNREFSYTDYSFAVNKNLYGFTLSAALVATSTSAYRGASDQNLGRTAVVVGVKKVF